MIMSQVTIISFGFLHGEPPEKLRGHRLAVALS